MGNSPSNTENEGEISPDNIETLGYRVLGVQPNSPASQAGLVSFFDFLLGCNGSMLLDEEDLDFVKILKDNIDKELELLVFNIKSQSTRLVNMTPRENWGGHGLLGVTIRLDDYANAEERLIRILSISPNSPAHIAGLQPLKDYLLGTATASFSSDSILIDVLEEYEDKVIEIYVYNTESDEVRVVNLMPSLSWGEGEGLLGAEVGTGYLHRLPYSCRETIGKSLEREVKKVRVLDDSNAVPADEDTLVDLTSLGEKEVSQDSVVQHEPEESVLEKTEAAAPSSNASPLISNLPPPPPPINGITPAPGNAAMPSLPLPPPPTIVSK